MSRLRGLCLVLAACGGGGGFPDAASFYDAPPTGTFSLTWSVIDHNSQPISCDRIAGQAMTVLAHNLAFDGGQTQIFSCSTGMGTSQQLVPGTYELDFELAASDGLLATAPKQVPVVIEANANTELAPVTFQVEALGGVVLKLASGKPGGNCGAAPNGADIANVSITLTHNSDVSCEPVTLSISGGGTYTIDCTTPVDGPCIEEGQMITATGIPSDSYTIRVRGKKSNGTVCWANNDTIQVPALNKTLLRTLNLAQQTQTAGCQ